MTSRLTLVYFLMDTLKSRWLGALQLSGNEIALGDLLMGDFTSQNLPFTPLQYLSCLLHLTLLYHRISYPYICNAPISTPYPTPHRPPQFHFHDIPSHLYTFQWFNWCFLETVKRRFIMVDLYSLFLMVSRRSSTPLYLSFELSPLLQHCIFHVSMQSALTII